MALKIFSTVVESLIDLDEMILIFFNETKLKKEQIVDIKYQDHNDKSGFGSINYIIIYDDGKEYE